MIKIGRPSRVFTKTFAKSNPSAIVLAYQSATPKIVSFGFTTYGIDFLTGPSQAARVAAAVVNPTYFRKSLLDVDEFSNVFLSPKNSSVGISSTNSFLLSVSTIELSFSSSTLCQYFLFEAIYIEFIFLIINDDIYHILIHLVEQWLPLLYHTSLLIVS